MAVLFTFLCDGCGTEGHGTPGDYLTPLPPLGWTWFWGGELRAPGPHACSDACWAKVCRSPEGKLYLPDSHARRFEAHRQTRSRDVCPAPDMTPQRSASTPSLVYFIQRGDDGPVKIGHSKNVLGRLSQLQCGIPERLRLLGVLDGGKAEEQRLHRYFGAHCIHGEWFHPAPDVLAYILKHGRGA